MCFMISEKTKNKFLELFKLQNSVSKIITVFIDLFFVPNDFFFLFWVMYSCFPGFYV